MLSSELYAIPALLGAAIVVAAARLGLGGVAWALVGAAACFLLRMVGLRFRLDAPHPPGRPAGGPDDEGESQERER